jgi:hypothetical protein
VGKKIKGTEAGHGPVTVVSKMLGKFKEKVEVAI